MQLIAFPKSWRLALLGQVAVILLGVSQALDPFTYKHRIQ